MRREKIEILHTHKHGSNFWGAIISLLTGVPVFLAHEHSWQYSGNRGRMLIDRFLIARRATRMIAVSAPDRESMISIEHIDPSKIVVIPNGITFDTPADVSAVRGELRLPPGALTIACVGVRRGEARRSRDRGTRAAAPGPAGSPAARHRRLPVGARNAAGARAAPWSSRIASTFWVSGTTCRACSRSVTSPCSPPTGKEPRSRSWSTWRRAARSLRAASAAFR